MRTCSEPGCPLPSFARGFCKKHYAAHRTSGTLAMAERDPVKRFWGYVDKGNGDGCWLWTGKDVTSNGYGRAYIEGRKPMAHRLAYELVVGVIPDEMQLDHLCHNADWTCVVNDQCRHKLCVRPDHLEAVTARENQLRAPSPSTLNAVKTECLRGHAFTPDNTYVHTWKGRVMRTCKECQRRRVRESHARKRITRAGG